MHYTTGLKDFLSQTYINNSLLFILCPTYNRANVSVIEGTRQILNSYLWKKGDTEPSIYTVRKITDRKVFKKHVDNILSQHSIFESVNYLQDDEDHVLIKFKLTDEDLVLIRRLAEKDFQMTEEDIDLVYRHDIGKTLLDKTDGGVATFKTALRRRFNMTDEFKTKEGYFTLDNVLEPFFEKDKPLLLPFDFRDEVWLKDPIGIREFRNWLNK